MARSSRRDFLKSSVAATVFSGLGSAIATTAGTLTKRSATDWVILGKSNVKVTRLAFGTGTYGGRVQRQLGQQEFTRMVRYAYDKWHPVLRDRGQLPRNAPDAGCRAEGSATR